MLIIRCLGVDVQGIFKVSGSAKRMQELQTVFDSPPRYGKGLDWTGYTVHDAASLLLRYLIQLPESLVPTAFYKRALCVRVHVNSPEAKSDNSIDVKAANLALLSIVRDIPLLSRYALMYVLDLLAVFGSKEETNGTNSVILASIFKSCILANPTVEDTDPIAYAKSKDLVTFMIENNEFFVENLKPVSKQSKHD